MHFLKKDHHFRFAAFLGAAACFLTLAAMGLLIPLFSGLLAYQLVFFISERFLPRDLEMRTAKRHTVARFFALTVILCVLTLSVIAIYLAAEYFLKDRASLQEVIIKVSDVIDSFKAFLPQTITDHIPGHEALFMNSGIWLKSHAGVVGSYGLMTLTSVALALFGMLVGSMVAISEPSRGPASGPVSRHLFAQINQLKEFFWHVASAQVLISAINTACTALYLFIILPAFGINLSLRTALVTTTFLVGLIPQAGNLVANTIITIVSLEYSPFVSVTSLAFGVGIHKLEYLWGGKIIGKKINSSVWEILLSLLICEHLFGLAGLVLAPVFYAWLKSEFNAWDSANTPKQCPLLLRNNSGTNETHQSLKRHQPGEM